MKRVPKKWRTLVRSKGTPEFSKIKVVGSERNSVDMRAMELSCVPANLPKEICVVLS